MFTTMHRFVLIITFALMGLLGTEVLGAEKPGLLLYSAGVDAILADDLDQGLHAALISLEQHGLTVPGENQPDDLEPINMLYKVLLSQLSVQVHAVQPKGPGEIPIAAQVAVLGNSGASVETIAAAIRQLFQRRGPSLTPVADHADLWSFQEPGGPMIYWGTTQSGGSNALVASVNGLPDSQAVDLSGFELPAGATPLLGMQLNLSQFSGLLSMMMSMSNPEAIPALESLGIMGPDAMDISLAWGADGDRGVVGGRITNIGKHFGGLLGGGTLSDSDFQAIPKDASAFDVQRINLSGLPAFLNSIIKNVVPPGQLPTGPDGQPMSPIAVGVQKAQPFLGINLDSQFFAYLGDSLAMYRSNVTGGDSLYSMVGLVSLKNAAGMKQSLKTLAGHLDQRVAPMADGHVRFVNWTQGDVDMLTVTFPGLPIPVQLTLGVAGDHLIAGLMPEAVQAAATQLGAATCVLDNPAYAKVRPHAKQQMIRIQFTDTAQRIPGGYGLTSALMAAIGNYARPKGHVAGGIAAVMPSFTDLMSGASSCIFVQRMEGDDLVIEGSTDRSVISGMTAMVSELSSSPILLAALAAGVLMPALSNARVAARSMQEKTTLRSAWMACHAYAADHDGKLPPSLSSLVKRGYAEPDQIRGMTYYPYAKKISALRFPSDHVILTGDDWNEGVNVAFADGHVANVTYNRIETLLKETEEVNQKAQE